MRLRVLLAAVLSAAATLQCAAQDSTRETQDKIDRVRANDARNAPVTNTSTSVGVSPSEIDDLTRKLEAGFGKRKAESERQPTSMEVWAANKAWADRTALEAQARAGNPDANFNMGNQYFYGSNSYFKDHAQALRLYLVAAAKRDDALFLAGRMIFQGDATPADEERGRSMMEAAAKDGLADAKTFLASHPRVARTEHFPNMITRMAPPQPDGQMVLKRDKYEKRIWALMDGKVQDPTNSEYATAADFYARGIGTPRDARKAYEFALRAKAGYLEDFQWAKTYGPIMTWAELHRKEDPAAFAKAADEYFAYDGRLQARYYQAVAACMQGDLVKQRYLLGLAVTDQPNETYSHVPPMARVDLGLMQIAGEGGPVDEASGIQNLLAERKNPEAQYYLGHFAANGTHGQKKDPVAARTWLESAAKGGQPDAIRELAEMNTAGNGSR